MWDERTRAELTHELGQLERLLSEYQPLIDDSLADEPDLVQLAALGAVLQSFYNGVEALFQTIAKRVDRDFPTGETWHKDLLQQMGRPTECRSAVISMCMIEQLEPYLGFRHVSRHSYTFELDWNKMRTLVGDLTRVRTAFYAEIKSILDSQ